VRLFVGVPLDPALARDLGRVADELRQRVDRHSPRAKLTWVAPERLHFTVRFIGETDEGPAAGIRDALAPPLGVAPFDLEVAELGAFPERGKPRVLWVGVGAGHDEMVRVEREVSARLAACGIAPEDRPYSPHLTLARVREPAGLRAGDVLEGLARSIGTQRVAAITLFQSRLSPQGPTYVALQQTPLGNPVL
jgi:RNA 2',3'-cyclic 3'-phosphodiesterase